MKIHRGLKRVRKMSLREQQYLLLLPRLIKPKRTQGKVSMLINLARTIMTLTAQIVTVKTLKLTQTDLL